MANPNLAAATSVYAANAQLSLTSTSATLLVANAASSGKVYLIDSIVVSNVDGVNAADISVVRFNSATNTGTAFPICSTVVIPVDASLIVVGTENKINKFLSLMEGFGISDLTRTGKIALARAN